MIACPICLNKLPSYRPVKWDPYYRCPCGALFQVRFRHALPHFASIGLRKTEPLRLPPPGDYYLYRSLLKSLFGSLRAGCDEHRRKRAGELANLCDLIRFGDSHPAPIRGESAEAISLGESELVLPSKGPCWPDFGDFEELHTNCDFASWCLERIGDGRFSDNEASGFGYVYQHFPHVSYYWSDNEAHTAMWLKAARGQLPSPRRAQVRSRLPW